MMPASVRNVVLTVTLIRSLEPSSCVSALPNELLFEIFHVRLSRLIEFTCNDCLSFSSHRPIIVMCVQAIEPDISDYLEQPYDDAETDQRNVRKCCVS